MENKNLFGVKKGQEEMVGFVLIVVVVSVVLLFFLGISLQNKEAGIESQEVENFISSFLPYTTECEIRAKNVSIRDLVFECVNTEDCSNGESSCEVLKDTLRGIVGVSWNVGERNPNKGYKLDILSNNIGIISLGEGNLTGFYKGSLQNFAKAGDTVDITFRVYS